MLTWNIGAHLKSIGRFLTSCTVGFSTVWPTSVHDLVDAVLLSWKKEARVALNEKRQFASQAFY